MSNPQPGSSSSEPLSTTSTSFDQIISFQHDSDASGVIPSSFFDVPIDLGAGNSLISSLGADHDPLHGLPPIATDAVLSADFGSFVSSQPMIHPMQLDQSLLASTDPNQAAPLLSFADFSTDFAALQQSLGLQSNDILVHAAPFADIPSQVLATVPTTSSNPTKDAKPKAPKKESQTQLKDGQTQGETKPKPKKSKPKKEPVTNPDGTVVAAAAPKPKRPKKKTEKKNTDASTPSQLDASLATSLNSAPIATSASTSTSTSVPAPSTSSASFVPPQSKSASSKKSGSRNASGNPSKASGARQGSSTAKPRQRSGSQRSSVGRATTRERDMTTPALGGGSRLGSIRPGQEADAEDDEMGLTPSGPAANRASSRAGVRGGAGAGAGAGEEEEPEDEAEGEADDGAEDLEGDHFSMQAAIYTAQQRNMGLLSMVMDDDQLDRHMASRRGALNKTSVRKLINHVLSQSVNQHVAMVVSGVAKIFIGEIIERARAVQESRSESGALKPSHLQEAYRQYRLQRERPGNYPPGTNYGAPGLGKRRRLF